MQRWSSIEHSSVSRSLKSVLSGTYCFGILTLHSTGSYLHMRLVCHARPDMRDSRRTMKAILSNHKKRAFHVEGTCSRRTQTGKSLTTHPAVSSSFTAGQFHSVDAAPLSNQVASAHASKTARKKCFTTSKEHMNFKGPQHSWQSNMNKTWTENWCASFCPETIHRPATSQRSSGTDFRAQSAPRGRKKLTGQLMVSTGFFKGISVEYPSWGRCT